ADRSYGHPPPLGRGTESLSPTAPVMFVIAGSVSTPDVASPLCAAPAWTLTAIGIRVPPINRNAAVPPYDVTRSLKVSGFQDARPAVSVSVPTPSATRPPKALPLPYSVLGRP